MRDVRCWRNDDGSAECDIPHQYRHHSPAGFEFGYGGSGPAELALNILALYLGPPPPIADPDDEEIEDPPIKLWDGSYVHGDAWDLHHAFKRELIATLPRTGGTIPGIVIEAWVTAKLAGRSLR